MSAQQIPNLHTLLASRRGGRGLVRGRGRGRFSRGRDAGESSSATKDEIVQNTDNDAAVSRMSAVDTGYLDDPFAKLFVTSRAVMTKRFPIINRGTYVRTTSIDMLVEKFVGSNSTRPKQIISLGAGTDTRYFRLLTKYSCLPLVYHELDFAANTLQKITAIQSTPSLQALITARLSNPTSLQISPDTTALTSPTYNIHPIDLRNLTDSTKAPQIPNLSSKLPTLILSECCLCYLTPFEADAILQSFSDYYIPAPAPLSLILYEPIRPHDSFGKVMISNLSQRGIHLPTLKKYSSLFRQRERMKTVGLDDGQGSSDVDFIWERWIDEGEKDRIVQCEMLDEVEEWKLLAQHYCVSWGWRDGCGEDSNVFGSAWGGINAQPSLDEDEGG